MTTDEHQVRRAYRTAANLRGEQIRLQRRRDEIEHEDLHHPLDVERAARLSTRIERLAVEIAEADAREARGGA